MSCPQLPPWLWTGHPSSRMYVLARRAWPRMSVLVKRGWDGMAKDTRRRMVDAAVASGVPQLTDALPTAGMTPDDAADLACLLINLLEGAHVLCRATSSLEPFDRAGRAAVILAGITPPSARSNTAT